MYWREGGTGKRVWAEQGGTGGGEVGMGGTDAVGRSVARASGWTGGGERGTGQSIN